MAKSAVIMSVARQMSRSGKGSGSGVRTREVVPPLGIRGRVPGVRGTGNEPRFGRPKITSRPGGYTKPSLPRRVPGGVTGGGIYRD